MICLDTFPKSLKITWLRRFYDNACKSGWKHFVIDTLPDVLHITNFGYAFMFKLIKTCKNAFWIDVFSAFLELRKCIETNSNILSPVWYNESICKGYKPKTVHSVRERTDRGP